MQKNWHPASSLNLHWQRLQEIHKIKTSDFVIGKWIS